MGLKLNHFLVHLQALPPGFCADSFCILLDLFSLLHTHTHMQEGTEGGREEGEKEEILPQRVGYVLTKEKRRLHLHSVFTELEWSLLEPQRP